MKRIVHLFDHLTISWKVFLITFVLVESVILILGFTYYTRSSDLLVTSQKKYAEQMVKKSDEYLETNLRYIQGFFLSIANDARIQNDAYSDVQLWFNEKLIYYIPNAQHIHLLEMSANAGQSGRVVSSTSPYAWFLLEDRDFLGKLDALKEPGQMNWIGPYYSPVSELTVSAVMKLQTGPGKAPKILMLDLSLNKLYTALFSNKSSEMQGDLLLLDVMNEPVYGGAPYVEYDVYERKYRFQLLPRDVFESGWSQTYWTDHWLIRSRNNLLGWQVLMIVNQTQLLHPLFNLNWFVWILGLVSFLFALGIAYTITMFISKPIVKISTLMNRMDLDHLDERIHLNRRDELGMLGLHFNRMAQRISDLIKELKHSEEQKKLSDFIAMQSQIRPHFLFNTLHTIALEAEYGNNQKVNRLISSLSEQLQYILHSSPRPVLFREELQATERYVELMMARYEGVFRLELDIDTTTLSCQLPKFILQPLIENSIFHGLVPGEQGGTLFINSSSAGDYWEILIEDDGVGMTGEQLARLVSQLEAAEANEAAGTALAGAEPYRPGRGSGIGLRNVHKRFQLMFGARYSLTLESERGTGTRIRLRLPIQKQQVEMGLTEGANHENDSTH